MSGAAAARRRAGARAAAGFTLMELMIAIGIIAILAALIFPAMTAARRSAGVKATKATIERIKLACEAYFADFGDYPPSSLSALGVSTNGVNEGAESLLRCLTTRAGRGPYLQFEEKELVNTDDDALPQRGDPTKSSIEARELFELADAWGNPLVYFHNRDYKGGPRLERYIAATGERIACRPAPSAKTGSYPSLTTFMIWSIGPDGKNENGQGDDVCSWK
ncbi:MAG TPA: prepilin-type N-terminal cleavage/methylation domain-containing protein [Planctomycetota bacterium]|nr:prepilin-type N-terminal cleavage/methylation domain-containing protein [Planctomycetota bacterium]